MSFITNMTEFDAARQQIVEYVEAGRHDEDERISNLITEMELFVLREEGSPSVLHNISELPEDEQEQAIEEFVLSHLKRTAH